MDPYPDESIFKVVADTNKKLKIAIVEIMNVRQIPFQSLASTQSTLYILNTLEITLYHVPNPRAASIGTRFLRSFRTSHNLKICISKNEEDPLGQQFFGVIYVDILQILLTIENLVFENFVLFERGSGQGRLLSAKLTARNTADSQLKSLSFSFETVNANVKMEQCNRLFQFTLKSCPLLNEIRLKGYIADRGALNLDFGQHNQLKYIQLDFKGCRYYTFHHHFGKQWKNINEEILEENISEEEYENFPYYTNLVWMNDNGVEVQLADCQVIA